MSSEELLAPVAEVGVATFELLAAVALTVLGIEAELFAVEGLAGGFSLTSVWFVYMGAVALFAGLELLGRRRVLPRVVALAG